MIPDIIVSLPRNVPLPRFRLFQRVRFYSVLDEDEPGSGLVVGWSFVTREAIADIPVNGPDPHWRYVIQFDLSYQFGRVGEPQFVNEYDILEIVET